MSATELAASIGYTADTLLSLLLSWFPGLNTWYAPHKETPKKLVTLFLVLVVSIFVLFGACLRLNSVHQRRGRRHQAGYRLRQYPHRMLLILINLFRTTN